ncbi:MAG: hypothetical protein K2H60_04210 [Muribaculaceae bacterium]|nr:hypothetical protein [Muribaculaceae bacterium]
MKILHHFLLSAGLLLALSIFPSFAESEHVHRLTMQARPLSEIAFKPNAVWDLSDNDHISRHIPSCVTYGDTLLSETVDGERRWYALYADSAALIREESRLYEHEPLSPLLTAAIGNSAPATPLVYTTKGLHSHTFDLERVGTYLSYPPVKGKLIVAPQDTLAALMTYESCEYSEFGVSVSDSDSITSVEQKPLIRKFTRYRWFTHGKVPVAVQTVMENVESGASDTEPETIATAYVMDFSPFSEDMCPEAVKSDSPENDLIAQALANATVTYHGGIINVELGCAVELELAIALMSDGGVPYLQRTVPSAESGVVAIPCSSVPPGRYVLSLSTSSITVKHFIVID